MFGSMLGTAVAVPSYNFELYGREGTIYLSFAIKALHTLTSSIAGKSK